MGGIRDAWLKWKMLKLPWRKKFLIGQDLAGNTFWEFKDAINHNRLRRIVRYNRHVYHSDVQVSPQWHQWLRMTRFEPPTMQEQAADVARQTQLKHNARLADERWAAKKRYIEPPSSEAQPAVVAASEERDRILNRARDATQTGGSARTADRVAATVEKEDPWKQANETAANPGSKWQPEAWMPGAARR